MSYKFTGSKYQETKDLDVAEIAKLIRTDLKQAFSEYKFSVRIERFSMGQSINVIIKETDINDRFSDQAEELVKEVKEIIEQYNFDDSDMLSDYSHVRFYSHVRIES